METIVTQKWNDQFLTWLSGLSTTSGRSGPTKDAAGVRRWYQNEQLHREDGPAVEYPDGTAYWYRHGRKHREDGPAVSYAGGQKEWHLNGELRCLQTADGSRYWYCKGRRHRDNGPAIEEVDGRSAWYYNGYPVRSEEAV